MPSRVNVVSFNLHMEDEPHFKADLSWSPENVVVNILHDLADLASFSSQHLEKKARRKQDSGLASLFWRATG